MRVDLQELVDEVSRLLSAPATLEDADFTLLAYCAHDDGAAGALDTVRARSILTRGSPESTRRWFEEFGIASAEGPLRTPADPGAGILTRLMLPLRHAGRTRGYLWLLDGGRIDPTDTDDPALAAAVALAGEAARSLAEPAAVEDLSRPLALALTGAPASRVAAAGTLDAALPTGAGHVLLALAPGSGEAPPDPVLPAAATAVTTVDGVVAVLVPLPDPTDLRPAGAVAAASLAAFPAGSTAGVSRVRHGAGELAGQWNEACAAARVAAVVPRFSPVAHWAELGAWRLVSQLQAPDPAALPLLAEPVLSETAEVFLDCAGSASRAASALNIHRQTLYYRLSRIEALTGLDLADGEARLQLHCSLKAERLTGPALA